MADYDFVFASALAALKGSFVVPGNVRLNERKNHRFPTLLAPQRRLSCQRVEVVMKMSHGKSLPDLIQDAPTLQAVFTFGINPRHSSVLFHALRCELRGYRRGEPVTGFKAGNSQRLESAAADCRETAGR